MRNTIIKIVEQLYNYIRLGSFEEGYINHCRLYGALLVVNSDWYWYMRAWYPGSIDRYIFMKSGCFYLDMGVEVLEWNDELGMYMKIPDNKDVDEDCYNGRHI